MKDYDIDDGIYFDKEDLKGPNGGTTRQPLGCVGAKGDRPSVDQNLASEGQSFFFATS